MTATDIANQLGVSDSSVIRLARALGYSGFSSFQKDLQEQLYENINNQNIDMSPAEKLKMSLHNLDLMGNDLMVQLLNITIENLKYTLEKNSFEKIQEITDTLIGSKRKFILGFRGTASIAYFIGQKLRFLLPDISIITQGDSNLIEQLVDITSSDCIMISSFPRYTKICLSAIELANEVGAKIIVITDKLTSPIAKKANVVLQAKVDGLGFSNSYVVPMFLMDLILLSISRKIGHSYNKRISVLEDYINKNELY